MLNMRLTVSFHGRIDRLPAICGPEYFFLFLFSPGSFPFPRSTPCSFSSSFLPRPRAPSPSARPVRGLPPPLVRCTSCLPPAADGRQIRAGSAAVRRARAGLRRRSGAAAPQAGGEAVRWRRICGGAAPPGGAAGGWRRGGAGSRRRGGTGGGRRDRRPEAGGAAGPAAGGAAGPALAPSAGGGSAGGTDPFFFEKIFQHFFLNSFCFFRMNIFLMIKKIS